MRRAPWWEFSDVPDDSRPLLGYVLGVATGANWFWPIGIFWSFVTGTGSFNEGATHYVFVILIAIAFIILWTILAWIVVAPFYFLVRALGKLFKLKNAVYYVASGAATGALLCLLGKVIAMAPEPGDPPNWTFNLALLTIGGAVGAFVFWWIAVRQRTVVSV